MAMQEVRSEYVIDERHAHKAYEDNALPMGDRQTLSQRDMVARMTESLMHHKPRKVLELGTGSG